MKPYSIFLNGLTALVMALIFTQMPVLEAIDVEMILNDGGFASFDHFKAELYLNNHDTTVPDARIFGVLEIAGEFYFWPDFGTDVNYRELTIEPGEAYLTFLEFDFPDIDDAIPFGPMFFWGAWYVDIDHYGYDVKGFWLDYASPGDLYSYDAVIGNMRYIPATGPGGFLQGSPQDEPCNWRDEYPQFTHILTRSIAVMETEVTRQMWWDLQSLQPDLPDDPTNELYGADANNPVQRNTWYEAVLFANLLSLTNGYTRCYYTDSSYTSPVDHTNYTTEPLYCNFDANGYRLPTEGEWEYFTRAGTTGPFSCEEANYKDYTCGSPYCVSGEFPVLQEYAIFCANDNGASEPVGSKLSNPWNLKDVYGNVLEWCWDWRSDYPTNTVTDYAGPETGSVRVNRGGSWGNAACYCRSAYRYTDTPSTRWHYLGFRLLRVAL